MSQNKYTTNNNPTLVAVSNEDGETPVYLYADPLTHELIVQGGSGGGSLATLADFSVNDIEDGTTSYFGKTKPDGTWLIQSVTDTSVAYATVSNNGAVTTYTDAWDGRATLTYGRFDEAF